MHDEVEASNMMKLQAMEDTIIMLENDIEYINDIYDNHIFYDLDNLALDVQAAYTHSICPFFLGR
ncbi:hypothetical protein Taro_042377 [Colocasia esculenta]|uniref:Uncharacterized protein n=1 Tax=Colocasia esculenta TaxID=4460 RepID=A0A843WYE9_COLES|nr:hypothetical protein [Colocasia esculenta]